MLKNSHKLIIVLVLILVSFGVVGFLFLQFINGTSKVAQVVEHKTAIKTEVPPIDLAKLETDYLTRSSEILSDYLAIADVKDPNLTTTTEQAQSALLNLSLPTAYKERHLAEILLLGEISTLSKNNKTTATNNKIQELKEFFATK